MLNSFLGYYTYVGVEDKDWKYLYYRMISLPLRFLLNLILIELLHLILIELKNIVKRSEVTIWTQKGTFFAELFACLISKLFSLLLLLPT